MAGNMLCTQSHCSVLTLLVALASPPLGLFALYSFPLHSQIYLLTAHPDNRAVKTHRVLNSPSLAVTLLLEVVSGSPEEKAHTL